ncbi:hypothetical protein ABT173_45055 [Streptomyces sp. NPDC001795]|uniref:hypothetical protein n=1 Tax=unclassified Streptomyces TaxID=2593676 RepID=UPI003322B674
MFFAVLPAATQIERNYLREKALQGQHVAAARGYHGGRTKGIDDGPFVFARALKDNGVSVPEITRELTVKSGKNTGKSPPVASLDRVLTEAERDGA